MFSKQFFLHAPSVTSSLLLSSLLRQLGLFDVLARKATPRRLRILVCTWKTDVSILVFLTLCISSLFCVCKLNSTYQIILFLQHLERWEAMIRSTYFLTQDFEKWIRSCHQQEATCRDKKLCDRKNWKPTKWTSTDWCWHQHLSYWLALSIKSYLEGC